MSDKTPQQNAGAPLPAEKRSRIDRVLRHPLLIATFSIVVGTGVLGWLTERAKNIESRRIKSVAFLEERVDGFNSVLTGIFSYIKNPKRQTNAKLTELDKQVTNLFKNRLSNEINSVYLLQQPQYSDDYDDLIFEISDLVVVLNQIDNKSGLSASSVKAPKENDENISNDQFREFAETKIAKFKVAWKIEPKAGRVEGVWCELDSWAMMLWDRAKQLHLERLESATGF